MQKIEISKMTSNRSSKNVFQFKQGITCPGAPHGCELHQGDATMGSPIYGKSLVLVIIRLNLGSDQLESSV